MGKQSGGINDPFTGKVGTAVGTNWRGIAVIRSNPSKRTKPFTPGELQQQAKFKMMNRFLNHLNGLMKHTFNSIAIKMTGYNKGFSYNVKNAFKGTYPDLAINFQMVLLSRGDIPGIEFPIVSSAQEGTITFEWTDNSGTGKAKGEDMVFVAIYSENKKSWSHKLNVAARQETRFKMEANLFRGDSVHCYIGALAANEKDASDSSYIGTVTVL